MKLFSKSTLLISTLSLTEIWEELGYSTTFNWISFFFHHWEKKRKQKLAELELPYVSLQGMKELHCKLGIREWWARSLRETSKIHDNCYEQCWRRNPLNNLVTKSFSLSNLLSSESYLSLQFTACCDSVCFKFYHSSIPEASFTAASYLFSHFQNMRDVSVAASLLILMPPYTCMVQWPQMGIHRQNDIKGNFEFQIVNCSSIWADITYFLTRSLLYSNQQNTWGDSLSIFPFHFLTPWSPPRLRWQNCEGRQDKLDWRDNWS